MAVHELKCWARFFGEVWSGRKTFELRINDRDYRQGDTLILRETLDGTTQETGKLIVAGVTYLLAGEEFAGLTKGWVALAIKVHARDAGTPQGLNPSEPPFEFTGACDVCHQPIAGKGKRHRACETEGPEGGRRG